MKRYLLFAGDRFYPYGGWKDFISSYDTIDEAKAALDDPLTRHSYGGYPLGTYDWWHVIDNTTGKEVA